MYEASQRPRGTLEESEVDAFTISTSIRSFVEMAGGFAHLEFRQRAIC